MSKRNNPGWPDPADWARRLHDELEKAGNDYQSASWAVADDPEEFAGVNLKQARAAEALLAIHAALRELPLFEKSKGAAILHDVAGALADVMMGGKPRLFASVRPGSPGGDGIQRNYVKVWVVLAVRMLKEAHELPDARARVIVARIFGNAGATGRKGHALSASTIKEWCEKAHPLASNRADAKVYHEVQSCLDAYRAASEWPGSYESTVAWIERIAADPLLSLKYG